MSRPSRNVDQQLLRAGQELLPATGIRALSIRQVTERAGVNLGMFHYHFKSKDIFVRAVLEQKYNDMFASLELESHRFPMAVENLRAAVNVLARFGRDNRGLLVKLINDAFSGETVAKEFMQANMPRHIRVVSALLVQSQNEGSLSKKAVSQALAFLMGGVGAPILLGWAAIANGFVPTLFAHELEQSVFTDAAIAERVDMALIGLAASRKMTKSGVRK